MLVIAAASRDLWISRLERLHDLSSRGAPSRSGQSDQFDALSAPLCPRSPPLRCGGHDDLTDGWGLVVVKEVSVKPIYAAQHVGRVAVFEEPTGWQKVDRQLQEVRLRLDTAESEEQYQAVGLLCREVLISVAQEVYDPSHHASIDGVVISTSDAKRGLGRQRSAGSCARGRQSFARFATQAHRRF
jgi:hypothetical protein